MIKVLAVLATTLPLFSPIIITNNTFSEVSIFPMLYELHHEISFTYTVAPLENVRFTFIIEKSNRVRRTVYTKNIVSTGVWKDTFELFSNEANFTQTLTLHASTEHYGVATCTFPLTFLKEKPHIDLNYEDTYYMPNSLSVIDSLGRVVVYHEKMKFVNFGKYYESLSNLYFDISNMVIEYESSYSDYLHIGTSVEIGIIDFNNLFPRIEISKETNAKMFLGELTMSADGIYIIRLNEKMYVDRNTHMMSRTKEEGYVETNKLYFPLNRFEDVKDMRFYVRIKNLGISKIEVLNYSNYIPLKPYIGTCPTSSYCVKSSASNLDDSSVEGQVFAK